MPELQDAAWVLVSDNELAVNDMEKNKNELTAEMFGEMYVKWRLEEGLYSSDKGDVVISVNEDSGERSVTLNQLAREMGTTMLPYLATHPDVGFESFNRNLWNIAKIGKVSYYEGKLSSEYPYCQIIEECYKACDNLGKQPTVMIVYIRFGKGQKIQMLQYAHLKCYIYMSYGIKYLDVNISYDNDEDETMSTTGTTQMWIA